VYLLKHQCRARLEFLPCLSEQKIRRLIVLITALVPVPSRYFLIKTSKPKPLSAAGKASLAGRDQPAKDPKGPVIVPVESYTKKKELNRDLKPTNLTNLAASEQQRKTDLAAQIGRCGFGSHSTEPKAHKNQFFPGQKLELETTKRKLAWESWWLVVDASVHRHQIVEQTRQARISSSTVRPGNDTN